jgi:hypothetical protein
MNDVEKLAAKIAGWLQEKQATGVSRRDIQRGPCSGLSREAMNDALDLLADNHWLRVRAAKAGVVGRPPEEFDVNPEVRKQSDDINRTPEGDGVVRVSSVLSEGSGILTTNRTAEGGDLSILSAGSGSEWSQFDDALPMEGGAV